MSQHHDSITADIFKHSRFQSSSAAVTPASGAHAAAVSPALYMTLEAKSDQPFSLGMQT